ncbi:transcription termination factor 4, mitochondrial [Paroedura picta]|uniref:transcription termination factor 4, mitochondrial n=1 Tax=Paroedura picta TaxID=143630 RepID=UPI0040579967
MCALQLGRLCGQVLKRHNFASLACIQLFSLNSSPLGFHLSLQYLGSRLIGTSSDQSEKSSCLANCNPSHIGKVVDSFLDMGFNHAQIKELLSVQPRLSSQTGLAVVSELLLLGLSNDSLLKVLQKSPELLRISPKHLKERTDLLRKFNFKEGSLDYLVIQCPSIFTMPKSKIEALKDLLREKCLFTAEEMSKIIRTCPNVLLEDLDDLEYKFQFAYFRMGVKQREIVNSGFLQTPLARIKDRTIFLERLGLYQTPDKKNQTQIVNPKLKAIVRASETHFVTRIACSTIEEYEIFKKLLAREEQKLNEDGTLEAELSDRESDEESDTE